MAIFANKRLGSIRIDRTKLRHQDINYEIIWRAGKKNPSDYLSRHPIKATEKYKDEALEDVKLLYTLHNNDYVLKEMTTSLIKRDHVLQAVIQHVQEGKKPTTPELHHYQNIFEELSISAAGLLLRQHRIVLRETLYARAITKARDIGHFGVTGIKRQIQAHFHFPHLDTLVETEVKYCHDCQLNTNKPTKEPLTPVHVPHKAWEYVSVNFFGPMPNGHHLLVI